MFKLDVAARVDRGLVRETNQDVARVVPRLALAIVADGMGGHDHGALASRTAADALAHGFEQRGGPGRDARETADRLRHAFGDANRGVAGQASGVQGLSQMGSTLVAAAFGSGHGVVANVGDSRCYRLRGDTLERLTQDHSYAAQLERSGATSTLEGRQAADQWAHVLTRSVNGLSDAAPDTRSVGCEPGDLYLLCSDGLWGGVADPTLRGILARARDADDACERLIGAAWAAGGLDNIGAAVVRLVPLQPRLEPSSSRGVERPSAPPGADG